MKSSVDFSRGVRGKYAGMKITVLGAVDEKWAVCVTKDSKDLIPFKLYRVETFANSDEIRSLNENGESSFYPRSWFAIVEVSEITRGLLESVA